MFLRGIISLVLVWLFYRALDQIFGLGSRRDGGGPSSPPGGQRAGSRSPRANQRSRRVEALEVLALPPSANDEQVRAAYRSLASKYHPDRVEHLGPELVELTGEKFKEIQAAYDQLMGRRRH
ncbi:MAG TPA: J domain-containing protein [Acidobacteriota bacterium]|nr:J domain-containing protein [Acidobacteriota bacterium]